MHTAIILFVVWCLVGYITANIKLVPFKNIEKKSKVSIFLGGPIWWFVFLQERNKE